MSKIKHADDCPWDKTRLTIQRTCTCGAADLVEASPQPAGVRVKGLEWDDQWGENYSISGRTQRRIMERALTPFIAYFIEQSPDDDSWWLMEGLLGDEIGGPFEHDWQARAAAQADYEARILSALEPQQEEAAAAIDGLPNPAEVQRWNAQAETEAYNRLADAQGLAHPTPAQKVQESQTVSVTLSNSERTNV